MEHEECLNKLLDLELTSAKHREELLQKYSDVLLRSESRVDNINRMIGNLIDVTKVHSQQNTTSQDIAQKLIELVNNKERRLQRLEERYDDLDKRYEALLEKYTELANRKNIETNFNFRQNNNDKQN